MVRYRKHTYNIHHQFLFIRQLQQTMKDNECLIHIAYSENYVAKLSREVQSSHFGASKSQITLHTGVYQVGTENRSTFCSLSDSLEHGPCGIWAHLKPVLDNVQRQHDMVDTVHFISDGPTTQYRQKANLFLFAKMLAMRNMTLGVYIFCKVRHTLT